VRRIAIGAKLSAIGVSLALASASPVVFASDDEDPLVEVQVLFERGQNAFEAFDYERAISSWVDALGTLPDSSEYDATRSMILYAIASARLDAFESDGDIKHLRHAKRLLEKYRSEQDPEDTETLASVDEYLEKVDAKLAENDAALTSSADESAGAEQPSPTGPAGSTAAAGDPTTPADDRSPSGDTGKGLIISGAVLAALGGGRAAGGGTAFGLKAARHSATVDEVFNGNQNELTFDQATQEFDSGRGAQALQIVSFAAGGALLATGAALMIVGLKRRKSAGNASAKSRAREAPGGVVLAPSVGRRIAGFTLAGRF